MIWRCQENVQLEVMESETRQGLGGGKSSRTYSYSSSQITPSVCLSGIAGSGRKEGHSPSPHSPPNLARLRLSRECVWGCQTDLPGTTLLSSLPTAFPLGLPSRPFAASAVGSWTWLSVPRRKGSRELRPGFSREGRPAGQGGDRQP